MTFRKRILSGVLPAAIGLSSLMGQTASPKPSAPAAVRTADAWNPDNVPVTDAQVIRTAALECSTQLAQPDIERHVRLIRMSDPRPSDAAGMKFHDAVERLSGHLSQPITDVALLDIPIGNAYSMRIGNRSMIVISDRDWPNPSPSMHERMTEIVMGHEITHVKLRAADSANVLSEVAERNHYIAYQQALDRAVSLLDKADPYRKPMEYLRDRQAYLPGYIRKLAGIFPDVPLSREPIDQDVMRVLAASCTRETAQKFVRAAYQDYSDPSSSLHELQADKGGIEATCDPEAAEMLLSLPGFAAQDRITNPLIQALRIHPSRSARLQQARELARHLPSYCRTSGMARR
jgi:hypothetical protein